MVPWSFAPAIAPRFRPGVRGRGGRDSILVAGEVDEVFAVKGDQTDAELDAAGRDPGVVLWAGSTAELCAGGELAPGSGDAVVVGDDRSSEGPLVDSSAQSWAPASDLGPLGQFADGDKGEPDPVADQSFLNPVGLLAFDELRRDVGVDDEVAHHLVSSGRNVVYISRRAIGCHVLKSLDEIMSSHGVGLGGSRQS